jgi:REP element-mobilizing transposase RayT
MSQDHNHLNHATWECKCHVVFMPKYRKKLLFGQIRRHLAQYSMHILISIPPKYWRRLLGI